MSSALRWRAFAFAAVAINLIAFLMVRVAPRPAVGIGAALDVAVTVPALYFFLVIRGGLQPLVSLLPLCLLAVVRATYLAPQIAWTRPAVAASAELAMVVLIALRLRRGLRAAEADPDILARIAAAAREIVPSTKVSAVLAGEIAVFYYAFASWKQRPHAPEGSRAFSIHQQSGVADLFTVLAGVSIIETVLVHLVVTRWSAAAAWTLSALSIYGTVWLVAMARSFILRPVLVSDTEMIARSGMLWTVRIPLAAISSVELGTAIYNMKLPPASQPNVVLQLLEPVTAHGICGMTRRISNLGLAIDDQTTFVRAIRHEA
uniref:Uncharacterized protein n=1 Tax=Solibacter usitatus (strain Ellin6076) TaxID=234267 RepID=Q02BH1_SOLUE